MKTRTKIIAPTIAAFIVLSSASPAAVTFSLTNGGSPFVTEDNTTFVASLTGNGFQNITNSTLSDDTQSTGLTTILASGNTGVNLTTQVSPAVGLGVGTDGFTAGDIVEFTFNQDVTLNSLWFAHGGGAARLGGVVTVTIGSTLLSGESIVPTNPGGGFFDEVVFDDTTVLAAGETLSIELTTGASNALGFNAIEVEIVPEPSSTALLGLGGLALIMRRRK